MSNSGGCVTNFIALLVAGTISAFAGTAGVIYWVNHGGDRVLGSSSAEVVPHSPGPSGPKPSVTPPSPTAVVPSQPAQAALESASAPSSPPSLGPRATACLANIRWTFDRDHPGNTSLDGLMFDVISVDGGREVGPGLPDIEVHAFSHQYHMRWNSGTIEVTLYEMRPPHGMLYGTCYRE